MVALRRHRQIAGTPLELLLPSNHGNVAVAQRELRYGDNAKDWAISSQILTLRPRMQFND